MNYHTVIDAVPIDRIIVELTAAGQLDPQPEMYAYRMLQDDNRHLHMGLIDTTKSRTFSSWLTAFQELAPRCAVFVNTLRIEPTVWHRDGPYAKCAINIPWFGSAYTFTEWTDDSELVEHIVSHPDGTVDRVEGRGNKAAGESAVLHKQAWALDIHSYHRVRSVLNGGYRGLLSIRFADPTLTYSQLRTFLKTKRLC